MPDLSPLHLISLQAAALFRFDAEDRMVGTNEPDQDPAPRLFLGRTVEGNIWRLGHTVPSDLAADLSQRLNREPAATDLERPPDCLDDLHTMLEVQAPVTSAWSGPAWFIPDHVRPATEVDVRFMYDLDLLLEEFLHLAGTFPHQQPCAAVFADGRIASVCSSVRLTNAAAEAGLHTLSGYRGRGFGGAATAAWSRAIRASGRIPLYSTSWDNTASRRVAEKLDLVLYGADLSIA